MDKRIKIILLSVGIIAVLAGISTWVSISPEIYDYSTLRRRSNVNEVLFAFTTALRRNHSAAYTLVDEDLYSELDKWMANREPQRCAETPYLDLISSGTNHGYSVTFGCYTKNGRWYKISVDDIWVEDLKVIEWGHISERR